ncbi:hypothetical protein GGX14DRAFT_398466 [Mycena pura]|uniref:Uncharacterized protein n=1 Tax=Mycena pura TaxID=153505 RepID=A0AAD6V6E5_9AGAR|nr:hypothetical protein GGX14DRAFT_398466 [Mycena pura]
MLWVARGGRRTRGGGSGAKGAAVEAAVRAPRGRHFILEGGNWSKLISGFQTLSYFGDAIDRLEIGLRSAPLWLLLFGFNLLILPQCRMRSTSLSSYVSLPATSTGFFVHSTGSEFKWIPGIVWAAGEPKDLTFHRSIAQWVEANGIERLREEQVGAVHLPQCFRAVPEEAESENPQLSHLFLLAIPTIARILTTGDSNPHWRHAECCPGELSAHELMRADPLANRTVFENSADLVFYRLDVGWSPEIIPALPAVNIWHNGRAIILLQDLSPLERRGEKRAFVGEDVFGDGPVPKRRKNIGSRTSPSLLRHMHGEALASRHQTTICAFPAREESNLTERLHNLLTQENAIFVDFIAQRGH